MAHRGGDRDTTRSSAAIRSLPHEPKASGHPPLYTPAGSVFAVFDAMRPLSPRRPGLPAKVPSPLPLPALGLARWLPVNVATVPRTSRIRALKFIRHGMLLLVVMPADLTPMINPH